MKVYLVSFADINYLKAQKRLNKSATKFGIDQKLSFSFCDLLHTKFYQNNREILDLKRGAGYWLWKPYIILEAMRQANDGDIIFYCDSGVEIIGDILPLVDICKENEGLMLFQVPFFTGKMTNTNWTKRDCFVLMNADTPEFHKAKQVSGTFQLYIKNQKNIQFVTEWLALCKDPRLITDIPNTCGFRNFPEFFDHRHDQSILSILAQRNNMETFRDPTQFANHLKMQEFRKIGELPTGVDYSSKPFTNSPYGTLFNHHRQKTTPLSQKFLDKFKNLKTIYKRGEPMAILEAKTNITIGITTFEHRFEQYFVPLLAKIREYDENTEIVVAINGEHNKDFDEKYRAQILRYLSNQKKIFPVMFPHFRGVSKLWNTIIVHATHDYILMLNDDIMITSETFLQKIKNLIVQNQGRTFTINESWSHFLVSREEIDYLGYFDERFIGIGEEDGDISWRYLHEYRQPIKSFKLKEFNNFAEDSVYNYKPTNIRSHSGTKYSQFNRDLIQNKYQYNQYGLPGMFGKPVTLVNPGPEQYANEKFFRNNRNKL